MALSDCLEEGEAITFDAVAIFPSFGLVEEKKEPIL